MGLLMDMATQRNGRFMCKQNSVNQEKIECNEKFVHEWNLITELKILQSQTGRK